MLVNLRQVLHRKPGLSDAFLASAARLLRLLQPDSMTAQLPALLNMWCDSVLRPEPKVSFGRLWEGCGGRLTQPSQRKSSFVQHCCGLDWIAFQHFRPQNESTRLQNVLLERCLLVAGERAISHALDAPTRVHVRTALHFADSDGDDDGGDNGDDDDDDYAPLLAACLDRCLENQIQQRLTGAFLDIVLANAAAGRIPLVLSAWRERILWRVTTTADGGSSPLLDADVRFVDLLVECGCDIASVLQAVRATGRSGSAQYYRVAEYALRRLAVLVSWANGLIFSNDDYLIVHIH